MTPADTGIRAVRTSTGNSGPKPGPGCIRTQSQTRPAGSSLDSSLDLDPRSLHHALPLRDVLANLRCQLLTGAAGCFQALCGEALAHLVRAQYLNDFAIEPLEHGVRRIGGRQ